MQRRRTIGAELAGDAVHFRVWAPGHEAVAVVIDGRDRPLDPEPHGYFSGLIDGARAGTRYRFRLRDGVYPDPASRFQPDGPHEPSMVIDPSTFRWTDGGWRGAGMRGRVIEEIHIGTFTREGTFAAAIEQFPRLAGVGINVLEVMPVSEFAGGFGWGYDGVDLWAPFHVYGTPDDFRRFVDAAHANGLAVVLDVVYNHMGPDGCYLSKFTPRYFTNKYENEWGEPMNFDGEDAHGVREFFAENAAHWIDEYHLDGLRLDATQSMFDAGATHIVREIAGRARAAAGRRSIVLIAENEPQEVAMLRDHGLDAMWNDDWHHAALVALTGNTEAYYTDYRGRAQEFVSMARLGFLYQGQRYAWQKKRRGTPSHEVEPERLVCCLENHDQVANSQSGARLGDLTSPGKRRAMTALLLLQPQTPMLFQGQELGAPAPFVYFADHEPELAKKVGEGRRDFLSQFASIDPARVADPEAASTFAMCKLDHARADEATVELHRSLLALRREEPFVQQRSDWLHGAVLNERCLLLRWLCDADRLLIVNLGEAFDLGPVSEPLLAHRDGWSVLWASDTVAEVEDGEGRWRIPAEAAVLLQPRRDRVTGERARSRG